MSLLHFLYKIRILKLNSYFSKSKPQLLFPKTPQCERSQSGRFLLNNFYVRIKLFQLLALRNTRTGSDMCKSLRNCGVALLCHTRSTLKLRHNRGALIMWVGAILRYNHYAKAMRGVNALICKVRQREGTQTKRILLYECSISTSS